MEFWDPIAGAVITQAINVVAAALCGVRFRLSDPADPPDERWLEVRITWRKGREGQGGPDGLA
ncbi:hypothetical protein FB565_000146 [Actinoplanes lutulentus]|uniref:Uncharacterized protein n=1 Tax=Actinoplanes lutulentus TaxID=1287878 RepID=A0A327YWY8_9ACTN|nr:hypothetical protein [Actinoplanes lutulentus]MBB2940442.1 hypothetical protein [Actinoplanes lutulentus]RAK25826.1 hypothetical protein B0I29_13035 [Actinoplanes lutulentus]